MTETIARVCLTQIQIPFKEPFRISLGEAAIKDAILVQLETEGGLVGVGECSAMVASFGYAADTPDRCWDDLVRTIAPSLLGRAPAEPEDIAALASGWAACSRFAIAGAETACWDLLGHGHHESLAELLGASEERIAAGVESGLAVGIYPTIVDLLRALEPHLEEGYKRIKLKIRPGYDRAAVQAVRQHFGDDLPLMVDGNGAYTRAHLDLFRQLDEFQLLMFEQPLAAGDLDGLAQLQAAVGTPICLDETADTPERTAAALDRGAGRIVSIKLQRVGGFGPARAIHDLCQERGIACWVGSMPELGIGQAQGLHLATLPNCKYPTDVEPSARWFVDDYVAPLLELAAPGRFEIPHRPGLGFQVDPVKLRRYQIRYREFTASPHE